jgi:hypothetical protein
VPLNISGSPAAAERTASQRAWRARVAQAAADATSASGLELDFTVERGRWVDLDSLIHPLARGLRDAGLFTRGFPELDVLVTTKREGDLPGAQITLADAATLRRRRVPGAVAVTVRADHVPRPGALRRKRAWRAAIAEAWGGRPPLTEQVWAEVVLAGAGSLLAPLEVILDALEPVLGRDPRGQPRQEFFPNDHVLTWLRVARAAPSSAARALTLRLGSRRG